MNPIDLKFMIEKREGHGEDSNPLFLVKDNFCAVGVFDGMGGSGATTCVSEYGNDHTKAYVASRIIKEAISNYLNNTEPYSDINAEGIWNTAKSRLEQEKSNFPTKASGLRSKLVRDYPTTLAIVTYEQKENGMSIINSYWAGDSRNYLWNSEGFYQISKDDLDVENDPLENLRNDGALSNCICSDRTFQINNKNIKVTGPVVIVSATDGCFGYFPTPMHFHEVLLTGLKLSGDKNEWENFVKEEICKVTGDDISLSLCAIGYEDFNTLKASFADDTIEGFEEISNLQAEIAALDIEIREKKALLENSIQAGWKSYKISYMKYIEPTQEDVVSSADLSDEGEEIKESVQDESKSFALGDTPTVPDNQPAIGIDNLSGGDEKDISSESKDFSCNEDIESKVADKEEDIDEGGKTPTDSKELPEDATIEPLSDVGGGEVAVVENAFTNAALSETEELDKEIDNTKEGVIEETKSSTESDSRIEKIEEDYAHLSSLESDKRSGTPPKRVGVHPESSTPFPKRVGGSSSKPGLRFGDREPRSTYASSKSSTSDFTIRVDEVFQSLLNEFERRPSKEIAIKLIDADSYSLLHEDIKNEIIQFLRSL